MKALPVVMLGLLAAAGCGCGKGTVPADRPAPELERIFAPLRVGTPPENAFQGLVRLPDGELRHYGFRGPQRAPTEHYYILSWDNGLSWDTVGVTLSPEAGTNENSPPPARSPWSGAWVRLESGSQGTWVLRSEEGIDGHYSREKVLDGSYDMLRQPLFLRSRQRMLVTAGRTEVSAGREILLGCVLYSDDDGRSWQAVDVPAGPVHPGLPPHRKPRWQNYAIEPTVTELADGRLWMLLRTSMDNLYESFSTDCGASWSAPSASRFYATCTMPTFFRLRDGRLLLFWCNTTPLPEQDRSADTSIRPEQRDGRWEDVFTNRDAIHVAISEDDGANWVGFRELYLDPLRNAADFATRDGIEVSLDRSVHQSQAVELPGGKVLVALGQHPLVRALLIFDPAWLYERERADSFTSGLEGWSTFKYVDGIRGHCAEDRDPGPPLVAHPDRPGQRALAIRHPRDQRLVCDLDGAVWNFPAGLSGTFTTRIRLNAGGSGGRISLIDRWFNPTDSLAWHYSMYTLAFDGEGRIEGRDLLTPGRWHELRFTWSDSRADSCRVSLDGTELAPALPLVRPSVNGISYVQFQGALRTDEAGFLVESVKAHTGR